MKKSHLYLIAFTRPGGATVNIGFYADTPSKNYRIYADGSDLGLRYEYLGNAEKALLTILNSQREHGVRDQITTYGTRDAIPRRGSNA